jgi:iron complex outermembrane receptor protein
MDIPLDPECIERVEVLEGPAARTLGAGAFAGAVNIVTHRAAGPSVSVSQNAGEHRLLRTHFDASMAKDKYGIWLSAGRISSDGYATDTDFDIRNAYLRAHYNDGESMVDIQAGVQDKKFGAAGFYSPRFPDQYEETGLWFASLRASTGKKLRVSPVAYWRHRSDHFLLDRANPTFYQNYHLTDIQGIQLNLSWKTGRIFHTVGADIRSENILSNNLGFPRFEPLPIPGTDSLFYTLQYGRTNYSWFQELNFNAGKWQFSGGVMMNWNTAYPTHPSLFPGLDISYSVGSHIKIYGSINRSLHLPTFTDLFYTDPVNQGNTTLRANRMVTYEGGIKAEGTGTDATLALFQNRGQDLVDWVWSYETKRFSPVNLNHFTASGIEVNFSHVFLRDRATDPIARVRLNYTYLDLQKSVSDSVSKYTHLRQKLSLFVSHRLPGRLEGTWTLSWQDRAGERIAYEQEGIGYYAIPYAPFWLADFTLSRTWRFLTAYATVTNLFDVSYADAGSAIQPGRWFRAGISVTFSRTEHGK